jgi:hypothetical protein
MMANGQFEAIKWCSSWTFQRLNQVSSCLKREGKYFTGNVVKFVEQMTDRCLQQWTTYAGASILFFCFIFPAARWKRPSASWRRNAP